MSWLTAWPQETQGVIFGLLRGKRWGGGGQLPLLPSRMSSLCLEPALHPHPCFPPGPLQPIHSPSDISPQHTSDALPLTQALHASCCSKDAVHTCLGGSQGPSRPTGLPLSFLLPLCFRLTEVSGAWTSGQVFHMLFPLSTTLFLFAYMTSSKSPFLIPRA